jgi:hypothetical protein
LGFQFLDCLILLIDDAEVAPT